MPRGIPRLSAAGAGICLGVQGALSAAWQSWSDVWGAAPSWASLLQAPAPLLLEQLLQLLQLVLAASQICWLGHCCE